MKKTKNGKPYWTCECGETDVRRKTDERVRLGEAVFRKPGCTRCKRPMQMMNKPGPTPAKLELVNA